MINRTVRDSNGCLLYRESVNTPDYSTDDWLINPDLSGVAGVECYYWKVTGTPPAGAVEEMSQAEKDVVDASRLSAAKAAKKLQLQQDADNYLTSRYPNNSANTLDVLYSESLRDRPVRAAYIRSWIEWRRMIADEIKTKQDAVDAAATVSAVNAVALDTATLDSEDPDITVAGAIAQTDSLELSTFLDANVTVTDPVTGVSGPFHLMQTMMNRREIFNDADSPLYSESQVPLIGAGGSVTNLNTIHGKLGWHHQEVVKQGWRRPTDILFYYGYPNSFNSAVNAWTNEKVAQDMAKYGIVVLGNGVQDPSHPDYANTSVIIPRIKALNPCTKIFGYVTLNQLQADFETKVNQWETLQVHGIFIDEAGYDYGKNRAEFNTAVDFIHGKTYAKLAFANAWNTDHVLGTADDPSYPNSTWNPTAAESKLTSDDWILLESLVVNTTAYSGNAGYASKSDWTARVVKMQGLRATYGVNFAAVGIINDDNANGQDLFDFAFTAAIMASLEANGTSSVSYGSSTAQVKHWVRPDTSKIGEAWNLSAAIQVDAGDADVY
ncbi:MAG TPA: hypothetical protein VLT59_00810, partial [Steroidobacteraceae bacterium]|nr:hypothetical protein [Steroidobacteraceae bacterium]